VIYWEPVSLISPPTLPVSDRPTLVPFIIHQLTSFLIATRVLSRERALRGQGVNSNREGSLDFMPPGNKYARAAGAKLLPLSAFMRKPFSPREN
jgi:hypothetical protein